MAGMQQRLAQWHSGDECATPYCDGMLAWWGLERKCQLYEGVF